jgi:hypothetical protein
MDFDTPVAQRTIEPLFPDGVLVLDWCISVLQLAHHITLHGEAFLPFCTEGSLFTPVRITAPPAESPSRIRFLQGDILSSPLEAVTFPAVITLPLLDCVPDPLFQAGFQTSRTFATNYLRNRIELPGLFPVIIVLSITIF